MKIHFLKTVWSDIILLEEKHHFALVDTGMNDQYEQLSSYLDELGVKTIEFILLTHFHRDHYGNIISLMENYEVKKVYFKEYGGHDYHTAWGTIADEEYRQSEREKWSNMKEVIVEKSTLCMVEGLKSISFEGNTLYLYSTENIVQKIWDDESNKETFHKNICNENVNSLAVFFESGKNPFHRDFFSHNSAKMCKVHSIITGLKSMTDLLPKDK